MDGTPFFAAHSHWQSKEPMFKMRREWFECAETPRARNGSMGSSSEPALGVVPKKTFSEFTRALLGFIVYIGFEQISAEYLVRVRVRERVKGEGEGEGEG